MKFGVKEHTIGTPNFTIIGEGRWYVSHAIKLQNFVTFAVFLPTGATRGTYQREIWNGITYRRFTVGCHISNRKSYVVYRIVTLSDH